MSVRRIQRLEKVMPIVDIVEGHTPSVNPLSNNGLISKKLLNKGAEVELAHTDDPTITADVVGESYKRIKKAAASLTIVGSNLARPYYEDVFIMVDSNHAEKRVAEWHDWTITVESTEPTGYFSGSAADSRFDSVDEDGQERIVGWWDVDHDVIWSRDRDTVDRLYGAFMRLALMATLHPKEINPQELQYVYSDHK